MPRKTIAHPAHPQGRPRLRARKADLLTPVRILGAIAKAPTSAPTVEDLAESLGTTRLKLLCALHHLERAGLVQRWQRGPRDLAIALSPLAVARLNLVLIASAGLEGRWARAGSEGKSKADRGPRAEAAGSRHIEGLALIIDPGQHEPWAIMSAVETVRRRMVRAAEAAVEEATAGL